MARALKQRNEDDWEDEAARVRRIGKAAEKESDKEWIFLVKKLTSILAKLISYPDRKDFAVQSIQDLANELSAWPREPK